MLEAGAHLSRGRARPGLWLAGTAARRAVLQVFTKGVNAGAANLWPGSDI